MSDGGAERDASPPEDVEVRVQTVDLSDGDLLRRAQAVAQHGDIGDHVLWADGHRPIHATGPTSVLWELLAEPSTIEEISHDIADEYGIDVDDAKGAVRQNTLTLWSAGTIEVAGTSWPRPTSTDILPPNL